MKTELLGPQLECMSLVLRKVSGLPLTIGRPIQDRRDNELILLIARGICHAQIIQAFWQMNQEWRRA